MLLKVVLLITYEELRCWFVFVCVGGGGGERERTCRCIRSAFVADDETQMFFI